VHLEYEDSASQDSADDGGFADIATQTVASAVTPLPSVTFRLVVEGAGAPRRLILDGRAPSPARIGSARTSDLVLEDPLVSRRHASVEAVGRRLRLVDLGSTNGTWVDGICVAEAFLAGGESVRFGTTVVRVEHDERSPGVELSARSSFGRVIGASTEMRRLYPLFERLARSRVNVVIEGETGTGKEALAESIHEEGDRAAGPFVVFDCTAVPPNLLESELFGHERGSFTGAVSSRRGVFEQAQGGTLLIDEIGDLELSLQPKLLRVLERGEIRRVGGGAPIPVDVRVLAATRRDLDRAVQAGTFRDDLFHRLAVARVELPPLRRRAGDVPLLVRHYWKVLGGDPEKLTSRLLRAWQQHTWPGNIRELRNAVARQIAIGDVVARPSEPPAVEPAAALEAEPMRDTIADVLHLGLPLIQARERVVLEFEQRYVAHCLAAHRGTVMRAASAAGVGRRYFQRLKARQQAAKGERE
jgi:DNA-binding NtrC family response regulator